MTKQSKISGQELVSRVIGILTSVGSSGIKKRWFRDKSRITNITWCWHKGIPFVIAEAQNSEWSKLEANKRLFPVLMEMYNSDGNWYILENPIYWFFGYNPFGEFCFGDSMFLRFNGQPDEIKWQMLHEQAVNDIDAFYDKINIFKYASRFIRKLRPRRDRGQK